jgi:AraC family transcriptional regulator
MNLETHFTPPLDGWSSGPGWPPAAVANTPASASIHVHRMRFGEHLRLGELSPGGQAGPLHLIRSSERVATLDIPAGWFSVSLPLTGLLRARSTDVDWQLRRRRVLAWTGALQIKAANVGGWVVLCGAPESWRGASVDATTIADMLPEEQACSRELFRLLIRLVRLAGRSQLDVPEVSLLIAQIATALHAQQTGLRNLLPRCAGRTHRGKHRTLLRLLRVQHLIRTQLDRHHDMALLARQVNCSVWHLTRVYRTVFGETPSDYATRLRLKHSLQLVRHSDMAFCDVTEAAGFESQSSFCRAFKKVFAMTPSEARAQYRENLCDVGSR